MARSDQLILVANPGSSSRKYAVYDAETLEVQAALHFELKHGTVVCTLHQDAQSRTIACAAATIAEATQELVAILTSEKILVTGKSVSAIGLRVVAPSAFFMQDHIMNDVATAKLGELEHLAPLHIAATLQELGSLRSHFPDATIIGVSDSAFHRTKPNYAWNYGINLADADRLDIKRFGYHGLSAEAVATILWNKGKLPPKVIICHLGSGSSVTGVFHGRSIDTTMGFTPNEGIIMATRSGSIGPDAVKALQTGLGLDDTAVEQYLNTKSGLLGLADSNDIRELLSREAEGDHSAHLALTTLIHTIHKSIGGMLVALNGCDLLVFTGTAGERSAVLRKRIVAHLEFADFILDGDLNDTCTDPESFTIVSQAAKSKPIVVIPADENRAIAQHTVAMKASAASETR